MVWDAIVIVVEDEGGSSICEGMVVSCLFMYTVD